MATTSKPRKKRSKKVGAIQIVDASKHEKEEVLDALEMNDLRQLENLSKDLQIAKLNMNLEEQALVNLKLQINSQQIHVHQKADVFETKKRKYQEFKSSINAKYGLKADEPLGYNPDTGEIVRQSQ